MSTIYAELGESSTKADEIRRYHQLRVPACRARVVGVMAIFRQLESATCQRFDAFSSTSRPYFAATTQNPKATAK
jgi:hypothetical protein